MINAVVRVALECVAGLWACYGGFLLLSVVYGLATGKLRTSPNAVGDLFAPVILHLGLPLIALVLIRKHR